MESLDIWVNVAKHLGVPDILKLFRLSKHYGKLSTRDDIWASIFRCHYGIWSKDEFPGKNWQEAKKHILSLRKRLLGLYYEGILLEHQDLMDEHRDELYIRSPGKAMVMWNGVGREEWLKEGDMQINNDPEKYGRHCRFKVRNGFALTPPLAFCWPHKPLDYCTAQGHTFLDYTKESLAACEVTSHVHSPFPECSFSRAAELCHCISYYDIAVKFSEIKDPRCPSLILIMTTESYDTLKRMCENSLHIPHAAYFFSANTRWALLEI